MSLKQGSHLEVEAVEFLDFFFITLKPRVE